MQPVADLPELPRCGVDALLLGIRAGLLSFGPVAQRVQLRFHLVHCPGEIRQLRRDARYVFSGGRSGLILSEADPADGKSPLTSTSVLAGGCARSTYSSRIARTDVISPTSRRK